ncbi:hypothetical protein KR100_13770 [Synechococcus sp. KORDI-100]|nr:hypothetical protein KR100_13770 [Synechococcus sp. KORDI-100]
MVAINIRHSKNNRQFARKEQNKQIINIITSANIGKTMPDQSQSVTALSNQMITSMNDHTNGVQKNFLGSQLRILNGCCQR